MTLILTCLTKNYIVQASDRRFTKIVNGKVIGYEDIHNKALIYRNHVVFAFTGLAELLRTSTIDWAAQHLSESEKLDNGLRRLRDRATDLINNSYSGYSSDLKRLAFVGAGFAEIEENGRWKLKPLYIVISNCREKNDRWLEKSRKEFRVDVEPLPEGGTFKLFIAGQLLSKNRKERLNNLIKWCVRHKEGPEIIGRLLAREIRKTSEANEYVGKNIMCTFVPRVRHANDNINYHPGAMLLDKPVISTEPQTLRLCEAIPLHARFALPPPFDHPRFVYIQGDDLALPYEGPVHVVRGQVIPPINIGDVQVTVPPFSPIPNLQADTSL